MPKRTEMIVTMQVCYVPLSPEREQAWRDASLLLLNLIYPALCDALKVDPVPSYTPDELPQI